MPIYYPPGGTSVTSLSQLTGPLDHVAVYDKGGAVYHASAYGVLADGTTDDRAALQSLIDTVSTAGGGTVRLPAGTILLGQSGSNAWCLHMRPNVTVEGAGRGRTVLKEKAGVGNSVRVFSSANGYSYSNFRARRFSIDGNSANQVGDPNKQRHGFFLWNATDVLIEDVEIYGMTGDGVSTFDAVYHVTLRGLYTHDNGRDGVSITGYGAYLWADNCRLVIDGAGQAFDGEINVGHDPFTDVVVSNCYIEQAGAGLFAATMGTSSATNRNKRWTFRDCTIIGRVNTTTCDDVLISGGSITATTGGSAVLAYYACSNVRIENVVITHADSTTYAVESTYSLSVQPDYIRVTGCRITTDGIGVRLWGVKNAVVRNNVIVGSGTASCPGVDVYVTAAVESLAVEGNLFKNFNASAVKVNTQSTNTIDRVMVRGNSFSDDQATATLTTGVSLNGTASQYRVVEVDNRVLGNGVTEVSDVTTGGPLTVRRTVANQLGNQDYNLVYAGPGSGSGGSAHVTRASSQYLSRADAAELQTGGGTFSVFLFAKLDSSPSDCALCSKWGGTKGWVVEWFGGNLHATVATGGVNYSAVAAMSSGSWHGVALVYDASAGKVRVSVDGSAFTEASAAAGADDAGSALWLGRFATTGYFDGSLTNFGYWPGRALTLSEVQSLYNGGAGVLYASLSGLGLGTSLAAWYQFASGATLSDSTGNGYTLTNNNTATFGVGLPQPPAFRSLVAADLPAMVGDSGSGGSQGAVPAPASGDAAAGKFLKASGAWAVPTGTATPGGSTTQLQYNAAGSLGGLTKVTSDGVDLILTQQTTPASPVDGELFHGTQKAVGVRASGINQYFVGCLYSQVASVTLANSNTETTLVDATGAVGTLTLPAGFWQVGKTLRITATGVYGSMAGSPGALQFKLKFGAAVILNDTGATMSASLTNRGWRAVAEVTCRSTGSSGTVFSQGVQTRNTTGTAAQLIDWESTAAVTVNTTASMAIDLTATFSTADAANTITLTNLVAEVLN